MPLADLSDYEVGRLLVVVSLASLPLVPLVVRAWVATDFTRCLRRAHRFLQGRLIRRAREERPDYRVIE